MPPRTFYGSAADEESRGAPAYPSYGGASPAPVAGSHPQLDEYRSGAPAQGPLEGSPGLANPYDDAYQNPHDSMPASDPFSSSHGHGRDSYDAYAPAPGRRLSVDDRPYGYPEGPSPNSLPGYGAEGGGRDSADVPLMQGNGGYFAPASAFDADGNHVGGIADYADGGVHDEDNVGGGARGRAGSEAGSYMPGGFHPGILEEGAGGGIRYGRIPQRVPRRYKTLKRVELYHGNLVLDCPVPSKLVDKLNDRESREFTHMRYTAATCDPDNFKDERYTLRQVLFDPPRRTELFIVLTMYNVSLEPQGCVPDRVGPRGRAPRQRQAARGSAELREQARVLAHRH